MKLGEIGYNVLWENCEHFAAYCRYGVAWSKQVLRSWISKMALFVAFYGKCLIVKCMFLLQSTDALYCITSETIKSTCIDSSQWNVDRPPFLWLYLCRGFKVLYFILQANNFLTAAVGVGTVVMVGALLKEMFWGNGEKKQET